MTLDEAIEHCLEQSEIDGICDCMAEHRQLAVWLKELKHYKKVHPNMNDVNRMVSDILDIVKKHHPDLDEDNDKLFDDIVGVIDCLDPDDYSNYN